ncbi:MAG TPA: aldo/keto reductase [Terriglobales bacterium]|nr:aldo/keto reductase [Terriglobales bacterium]
MQKMRELGRSGIKVAPLAFGGNVFGWTADEQMSFRLLDTFVDAGFNLIDTADSYSRWAPGNKGGESETIIGKWLKSSGKRNKVVIATKLGSEITPERKGLSRRYILTTVEESLQRLQTDYIDLYQSHRDDPSTPIEETLETYAQLVREGKVRAIGASNFTVERLQQSLDISARNGWPRYESLQPNYNLYERADFETKLEPLCLKEKVGVIPYFSLASGFLTGKYRTQAETASRPRAKMLKKYFDQRGLNILSALEQVAQRLKATQAQVALAWLMARPSITAPIASATSPEQLRELLLSTELHLDSSAVSVLDQASAYLPEPARTA